MTEWDGMSAFQASVGRDRMRLTRRTPLAGKSPRLHPCGLDVDVDDEGSGRNEDGANRHRNEKRDEAAVAQINQKPAAEARHNRAEPAGHHAKANAR